MIRIHYVYYVYFASSLGERVAETLGLDPATGAVSVLAATLVLQRRDATHRGNGMSKNLSISPTGRIRLAGNTRHHEHHSELPELDVWDMLELA